MQDGRGNIFYTDLSQVWRIAPDGRRTVAVPGVHTHELFIDDTGVLYGEHLWYEGDANGRWRHRVWCRKPDGRVSDVIPPKEGFLRDYSFVRDRAGNMYWAEPGPGTVIRKRSPVGAITTHAHAALREAGRMTATPDGTLYLVDAGALRRVSRDGSVTTILANLSARKEPPARRADPNDQMGIWTDRAGRPCVAVPAERLVLRVDPDRAVGADGSAVVLARSDPPWSPSGGTFDRGGNLWLLEYDPANAVRARRIGRERLLD